MTVLTQTERTFPTLEWKLNFDDFGSHPNPGLLNGVWTSRHVVTEKIKNALNIIGFEVYVRLDAASGFSSVIVQGNQAKNFQESFVMLEGDTFVYVSEDYMYVEKGFVA